MASLLRITIGLRYLQILCKRDKKRFVTTKP